MCRLNTAREHSRKKSYETTNSTTHDPYNEEPSLRKTEVPLTRKLLQSGTRAVRNDFKILKQKRKKR